MLTVNFWEDDALYDDFLGSTTVTVTLPASSFTTGPFTTPVVSVSTEFGTDFYAEVKAGGGVGGASFVYGPSLPSPFDEESAGAQFALASLIPEPQALMDPGFNGTFGNAMAQASVQNMGGKRFLILQPYLTALPRTGLPHDRYVAQLRFTDSPETITLGFFPTIVQADSSANDGVQDLRFTGSPVFEAFDVTTAPFSQIDRVIIAAQDVDGDAPDFPVLSARLGPFDCPTNFDPADVDRNGTVDVSDAIRVLRIIVGLPG